jgi:hypothetical protein
MIDNLFDDISNNKEWRLIEIREFENIINNISVFDSGLNSYDTQVKIILKSMLPMIYAHWEGFVKVSVEIIFRHLNLLELPADKYSGIYLATAYEQDLNKTPNIVNFERRIKHLNCFYDKFNYYVNFGLKIDTESNLNYKVLTKICKRLNIDNNKFSEYSKDLNKLLEHRNAIVHGENSLPFERYEEIKPYIELLENLMLDFESEIQDLLKDEKYLKEIK